MAITASKIGTSPLSWDWTHLNYTDLDEEDTSAIADAQKKLKTRFQNGEIGFYDAPFNEALSQAESSQILAAKLRSEGRFKDCLFLGIGGSSLGPISLLRALREKQRGDIAFHFVENPDPLDWKYTIRHLNPETTLVVGVTKSGTTYETISLLSLALDWLTEKRWPTHLVAITDPTKGELRIFADQRKIPSLAIAPSIGGRFSVFTPVGLFPLSLAGLDAQSFLKGATQVREYCEKTSAEKNPLWITASALLKHASKRGTHVMMPYSTGLRDFSSWFVQLWGESLGKDGKGFTPIASLGATDQHSILQLLRDGPDDKITFFVRPDRVEDPVVIQKALPLFEPYCGPSLNELLEIEYQAISRVLTRRNRPNLTLRLTQLDEVSMGALFYAFACLTAFTGTLMQVNPFDQPGVEEGKLYIREALERARSIS